MTRMVFRSLACFCTLLSTSLHAEEHAPQVEILQPGVRLTLVAEQPTIVTPIGVDVDQQGRVWVVSSHTHFPPGDYEGPKFDEVLIFGKDKRRTVFYNATYHTMGVLVGEDGWVYLSERNRVLRVKDTDGDGRGDLEENLLVLQTASEYPHNGLTSLAWLPNGELLVGLGENFARPWTLTGPDDREFHGTGEGGLFRCQPDGRDLHRIARGFWNPFGVCVRSDGEIFVVDNDPTERPPCRLLQIVENADYGFQKAYGTETHHPFVGWYGQLRGTLPMIHPVGEAPSGVTPLGRGLIVPTWSEHRIDYFALSREGASYEAKQIELVSGSRYFRPTCIAPDPSQTSKTKMTWYLTDWVDGRYEIHGYGRLWKLEIDLRSASWLGPTELEPANAQSELAADLRHNRRQVPRRELLKLAGQEDRFLAQAALTALARTTPDWQIDEVKQLPPKARIQALLALKLAARAEPGSDLSRIDPAPWVEMFLGDADPEVQFETLRWIADAGLTDYLGAAIKLLRRSDISYRLFEAAVATVNSLSGHADWGVRNSEMLLERVRDSSSPPNLRAFALRLLPRQSVEEFKSSEQSAQQQSEFPAGLSLELLQELLAVRDPTLSLEVVRTLAGSSSSGQSLLADLATDQSRSVQVRAESLVGLAAAAPAHLDLLLRLTQDEKQPVREEALRALRSTSLNEAQRGSLQGVAQEYPGSADLVRAVLDPESIANGRPEATDTDAWLERLQALPSTPDPASGYRIFNHPLLANCASCHRHSGRGNVVGPDLSGVAGQHDRKRLLESILQPSRQMAPEYRPTVILLNDGRAFEGIRLQSASYEVLRDKFGQNIRFELPEIDTIKELDQSFMPEGLVNTMTDRELRDLIEFLSFEPEAAEQSETAAQHLPK